MIPLRVGILGATGLVGRELIDCLERSKLNVGELRLMATERSAGSRLAFRGEELEVKRFDRGLLEGLDLLFTSAGAEAARMVAPLAGKAGVFMVDNSRAFRRDEDVPLVIPCINQLEVNGGPKLVANPNCSTIIVLLAMQGFCFEVRELVVSTYQAVSGAGRAGLDELERSLAGRGGEPAVFPAPIGRNLIPFIGNLVEGGETDEEEKMRFESRKILDRPGLQVSCTCVRVPTGRAHAASVFVRFRGEVDLGEVARCLERSDGVVHVPDQRAADELNPLAVEGRDEVFVGRLRKVGTDGLAFFAVGDQLRSGAALNAVRIAEKRFALKDHPERPL